MHFPEFWGIPEGFQVKISCLKRAAKVLKETVLWKRCNLSNIFLLVVLVQLDPSCTQEYKWRELEEQRQAQKLQRQLQQEQAYLLSLQQNQNLDSSKTAQQQSTKPPQNLEQDRIKPLQIPEMETTKQPQSADFALTSSSQSNSLEKTTEPKLPDLQGSAPDSEPIREVIPRSPLPPH